MKYIGYGTSFLNGGLHGLVPLIAEKLEKGREYTSRAFYTAGHMSIAVGLALGVVEGIDQLVQQNDAQLFAASVGTISITKLVIHPLHSLFDNSE